jgi:hypothetical protein
MKNHVAVLSSVLLSFILALVQAQPGSMPAPSLDGAVAKIFGNNKAYSGTLEFQFTDSTGKAMSMQGKIAYLDGNARYDWDMSEMMGKLGPGSAEKMKQMGMDKMTLIQLTDKGTAYIIYPNMKAYASQPTPKSKTAATDYKMETTKLGDETIDGHDCVKNKVVVTGPDGAPHEFTAWNATDLKEFPLKLQMTSGKGEPIVLHYTDVKLETPDAALFEPPADFKKYDNMMGMMMDRFGGGPPK